MFADHAISRRSAVFSWFLVFSSVFVAIQDRSWRIVVRVKAVVDHLRFFVNGLDHGRDGV